MDIQHLFQERLPYRPWCTNDFGCGLRVLPKATALQHRHIQPNPPQATAWLIFDLDYQGAALAWEKANLPVPTIIVKNPVNAHAHLFYGLESPVCTSVNARRKPPRYAKAVQFAMRTKLNADPGYAGLIAKNPFHPDWHTQWIPKLYDLGELSEYVTLPNRLPAPDPEPGGIGRNCDLFGLLRRWAYRQVRDFERKNRDFDRWDNIVLNQAEAINASTFRHDPLPFSEVKSTAKSVAKWVWVNFSDKASNEAFSQVQSERGQLGGRPRTTTECGDPWQELGISRATWYRRRKTGMLPPPDADAD